MNALVTSQCLFYTFWIRCARLKRIPRFLSRPSFCHCFKTLDEPDSYCSRWRSPDCSRGSDGARYGSCRAARNAAGNAGTHASYDTSGYGGTDATSYATDDSACCSTRNAASYGTCNAAFCSAWNAATCCSCSAARNAASYGSRWTARNAARTVHQPVRHQSPHYAVHL